MYAEGNAGETYILKRTKCCRNSSEEQWGDDAKGQLVLRNERGECERWSGKITKMSVKNVENCNNNKNI